MKNYSVLIPSYHSLGDSTELVTALIAAKASIEAWVKAGGVVISTMGRDPEEQSLVNLFQLEVADPGTGTEAIISIEPMFAKDIPGSKVDASGSSDNTPNNGQIYVEPLPSWATVVARNAAGQPISVAGRYGLGAIWAGAGFEITNIGTGIDADQSMFKGFKQLWENMMDWLTTSPITAVGREGKLATTWASIKK